MPRPIRLLSISHSYVVGLNRRLPGELARVGGRDWDVTAVGPLHFHGDLRDEQLERRADESCNVRGLPGRMSRRIHVFHYRRGLTKLLREDWDLVHLWEEPYILAGAQVAALLPPQVPLVFSTFQNIEKRYPLPFRHLEKRVLARSSAWIAYGETVARVLGARQDYAAIPSATIPPGVDTQLFQPDPVGRCTILEKLGWSESGAPVIGYLGRFVPEKGLEFLLRVLESQSHPWRALFIGTGPLEARLRRWGSRFGDRVVIATDVRHDDVPKALNAMDILVAPSETTSTWREQFGRMVAEAFACGVPVLSSDSGELPFTVGDGGLVRKERDHAAWTTTLSELLGSPKRREELQRAGRERALRVFSWPVVARQTLDFFADTLAARRPITRHQGATTS